jgi:NADH-quinone oxidoreductase subunit H
LFRNIYCNLVESDSARCAAGGWFGDGLLPGSLTWLAFAITGFVIAFVILNAVLGAVLIFIWAWRRIFARFQNRLGPNRWGPYGMLTSVADAVKTMLKEDVVPAEADRLIFNAAPVLMVVPVFLVFTVIPFGAGTYFIDLNIGILFIIAVTSGSVLAIVMASYGSANRISIFSGMRAVALLISYEIPMAISVIGAVMLAGSLSMGRIVAAQDVPFIIVMPLGFLVFFICALAEVAQTPFDLAEAESELGAGYLNDYSSMKFGLFYLAEFAAGIAAATVITTVFLSGWRGWWPVPSHIWFLLKMGIVLFMMMWVRFTWPRLRADQVMALAWKGLFELTLVNLVSTGVLIAVFADEESPGRLFSAGELWTMAAVNWGVFIVSIWAVSKVLAPKPYREPMPSPPARMYPVGVDEKPYTDAAVAAD